MRLPPPCLAPTSQVTYITTQKFIQKTTGITNHFDSVPQYFSEKKGTRDGGIVWDTTYTQPEFDKHNGGPIATEAASSKIGQQVVLSLLKGKLQYRLT